MIKLYELAGKENVIFSPYCWRVRLALLHKQLDFSGIETAFTDIKTIANGEFKTVPVLHDDNITINESFNIVKYLEEKYPLKPSLFNNDEGRALAVFIEAWANTLHGDIAKMAISDIHGHLQEKDKGYFRTSREKFFDNELELIQSESGETAKTSLLTKLSVLDAYLTESAFIGGATPLYADFIVFGTLKWLIVTSRTFIVPDFSKNTEQWFLKLDQMYCGEK
jgi:glutathione S-transferase